MNKLVVSATAEFLGLKVSQNNNEYFNSFWCFPQECMGQIFYPDDQKRKARTRILGNTTEDSKMMSCKEHVKYDLQIAIAVQPAKGGYPAQLNFQVIDIAPHQV